MEKKYTIGFITGVVALVLVIAGATLYNKNYQNILDENPDQDLFLLKFSEKSKIEVLTRTTFPDCAYGLIRIDKDEITLKCGWNIAGIYSSWTEYWRTYGKSATGEEEWWVRNNRKSRKINIDYGWSGDNIIVTRTTPFYKGRSGSDGILTEEFIVYRDGVKISAVYDPLNKALHRIIYREDRATNLIDFDFNDPRGNYVGVEKDINFKKLYVYGEKSGRIVMDPAIVLSSPADKGATTNVTGDVLTFIANCTTESNDDMANASIYVLYNTTQGWHNVTFNDISAYAWPNTTSIYLEETWTLPSYINTWPYLWKVECCTNQTIANHCRFSSGRMIALNIQPNVSAPPVLTPSTSVRTDQGVTCTLDGSALQAISRSELSYTNGVTNGLVNVSYVIVNQTGGVNLTTKQNTANLSWTWAGRGANFNLSEDYNISCKVWATDGKENSSIIESNIINVTNGRPWGLNITYPDEDFNALNGSDDSKVFTVNWTRPRQLLDADTYYYTITLDSPAGTPIYNLTGDIAGDSSLSENISDSGHVNSSTWDHGLPQFNTSDYDTGRYYITMTVCDKNYTGETSTRGECMSDISTNPIDIFDYDVEINPNARVSYFRLPPIGTGTRQKIIPIGQTDDSDGGIFKITFTNGFGNLNLTLSVNETTAAAGIADCVDLFCSNNTVSDMITAGRTLMNTQGFNMTNNSIQQIYYNVGSSPKYIWCFADSYGCAAGVVADWLFEFEVFPAPLQT